MEKQTYSRKELRNAFGSSPTKGTFCKKCKTYIPIFEDLSEQDFERLSKKSVEQPLLTVKELSKLTGCPITFAKIWVHHRGNSFIDILCPYCGEQLRTKEAKQCRHCKRGWHDKNNLKYLK